MIWQKKFLKIDCSKIIINANKDKMNKIVVATDFSENSKKGVLFSIQLALQMDCELIFFNAVQIFRPSIWDNVYYGQFEINEVARNQTVLETFIEAIFLKNNVSKINYSCVCEVGVSASSGTIDYATKIKASYICASTTGVGRIMKIFGTTASELIAFSPIPVFIVPKNYRIKPLKSIFFASDFKNFTEELRHIQKFSIPVKADIEVYHYDYQVHLDVGANKFQRIARNNKSESLKFHYKKLDDTKSIISHVEKDIRKSKLSLIVLFTKQNQNWFNRLFLSSLSAELSFDTKKPMLIFKKHII